ncbi:DUF4238 domain-containing protein [Spiroplasma turonicum]|uniref:DUF4238 domain-containing protein n=1 Tax=Spiroplasma turonicum TaxID=216946 RepID=A0A0K1P6L3_9MOLU|nr:DUF4238 domain-containing protein [Spiroplasma turonicum]AKU79849.1 hypothetical protein STURON_00603 [Spiroplasma turonicum]ALX70866.1 hypothetical protein STURO_v1c06010 [Spiroplasma turonicum]
MSNSKVNQHFLPKFYIKKWANNNIINYYNIKNNSYENYNIKERNKDPFLEKEFYEGTIYEFNKIENILSNMENSCSLVLSDIIEKFGKFQTIRITRKEIMLIKLFLALQWYRNKSSLIKKNNLDGDYLFNETFKNLNPEENKISMLNDIVLLYENYYLKIIRGDFEIYKLFNEDESYNSFSIRYHIKFLFKETYLNFIKLDNINDNFILNDHISVHIADNITSTPIIEFMPITPKLCITLNKTTALDCIPDTCIADYITRKNNPWGFYLLDTYFPEIFSKRNHRVNYIQKHKFNIKDLFIYDIKFFNSEQVKLINSLIYSQSILDVIFINKDDIKNAKVMIEKLNIQRIEEINR